MLFGEMVLKLKLASIDQVEHCLSVQEQLKREGRYKSLGSVFHDEGVLDMVEIERIMRELDRALDDQQNIPGYRIHELLGKGAVGKVYRGESVATGEAVAIKILSPILSEDEEYRARFGREAEAAMRIEHKNIMRAYGAGEARGFHFFVMEFIDGRPLDDYTRKQTLIEAPTLLRVIQQMLDALRHIERFQMVHRDIKPANILMTQDGVAKLCDLGLTKSTVDAQEHITRRGIVVGSPFYISPEQSLLGEVDIRSDIYSLGATAYHLITGIPPFPGRTAKEILELVVKGEKLDPREANPDISPGMEYLINRMMARYPDERYPDPQAALFDVASLMQTGTVEALKPKDEPRKRGWFWRRR